MKRKGMVAKGTTVDIYDDEQKNRMQKAFLLKLLLSRKSIGISRINLDN